jgi:biotin transporter BioY
MPKFAKYTVGFLMSFFLCEFLISFFLSDKLEK